MRSALMFHSTPRSSTEPTGRRFPPCSLIPDPRSLLVFLILLLASCSFDYGDQGSTNSDQPDIVMDNVEYMRVRSGDPVARFMAEKAQRFEERRIMDLDSFSFEQYEKKGADVNASGRGGSAEFMIDSGDIKMDGGIRIEVGSDDIIIDTKQLQWTDKDHTLVGGANEPVVVSRSNGTSFTGYGFFSDARKRTWEFSGGAGGSYIYDNKKDNEGTDTSGGDTGDTPNTGQ